jgi:hypothetical protein
MPRGRVAGRDNFHARGAGGKKFRVARRPGVLPRCSKRSAPPADGRAAGNRIIVEYQDRLDEVPCNTENEPAIGQTDLLVRSIEPAGAVVERMAAEAAAIVARLAA